MHPFFQLAFLSLFAKLPSIRMDKSYFDMYDEGGFKVRQKLREIVFG